MRFHYVLTVLSALAVGGTASAEHPPNVASAAHRFADTAEHLHRQIHRTRGHAHEGVDSHRLANAAEHFHRQIERGGSRRHLGHDFEELREAYRHLKHQVRYTGILRQHRHIGHDFEAMHHDFHRLEQAVAALRHRGHRGGRDYGRWNALLRQFR